MIFDIELQPTWMMRKKVFLKAIKINHINYFNTFWYIFIKNAFSNVLETVRKGYFELFPGFEVQTVEEPEESDQSADWHNRGHDGTRTADVHVALVRVTEAQLNLVKANAAIGGLFNARDFQALFLTSCFALMQLIRTNNTFLNWIRFSSSQMRTWDGRVRTVNATAVLSKENLVQ